MLNKFKTLILFFSSIVLSFYILESILYINYTYENISIKQIQEYEKKPILSMIGDHCLMYIRT